MSLFGALPFGGAPAQTPSLFGASTAASTVPAATTNTLSWNTPAVANPFNATAPATGAAAPPAVAFPAFNLPGAAPAPAVAAPVAAAAVPQAPTLGSVLREIQEAYTGANSRFRHPFFNRAPLGMPMPPQRPADFNEAQWEMVQAQNPSRQTLVPVQVVGYEALRARVVFQERQIAEQSRRCKETLEFVETVRGQLKTLQDTFLPGVKAQQMALSKRLLRVMGSLEVLRCKHNPLIPDEEVLFSRLQRLSSMLGGSVVLSARLAELSNSARALEETRASWSSRQREHVPVAASSDQLSQLGEYLAREQEGISKLVQVLKQDRANLTRLRSEGPTPPSF